MQLIQRHCVVPIIVRNCLLVMCAALIGLVGGCWQQDDSSRVPPPALQGEYGNIHEAAGAGNPAAVLEFLRSGADINGLDGYGESPLHHAVKHGKMATAAILVQEGVDVNVGTARGGDSPLYYAVMWQHWDIVELLLQNGANGDQKNAEGESPREYTIKQGINDRFEAAAQKSRDGDEKSPDSQAKTSCVPVPTPTGTSAVQGRPSVTLDNLVYVDSSAAHTQHPLVCGVGRDFPTGRELAFWNPQSQEFVHAVFPKGITAPENLGGKFVLHGRFQAIQNRKIYTMKQPPEDYRYLLVSSWEYKK